ncbi:MAG: hypothetical protein AAFP02_23865, partial [Bacteroidota bacterium]
AQTSFGTGVIQSIDWQTEIPDVGWITSNGAEPASQTGVAVDGCGDLAFYAVQTGSSNPFNLNLYAADGTIILADGMSNGPGLNAVRGGQELQVIRVPFYSNEWYVIYSEWSTDVGAPISNAAYNPARLMYSRVRLNSTYDLEVLERDILLEADGAAQFYTDGRAVSRTAFGNLNQHLLYACRRNEGQSSLSLDRWIITTTGITWAGNTGTVAVPWWSLTLAGSPMELSPTEDKIAVTCRNQSINQPDVIVFDALSFNNTNIDVISGGDLVLVPDGTANDLSSVLPYAAPIQTIAADPNLSLSYLSNFERKLSRIEFSPNGRFLYILNGGFTGLQINLCQISQEGLSTARKATV